jgi:hypothetical protein
MDGSGFRMKVSALSFFLVYCRTTTTGRRPIMRRKAQACMAQLASHRIACFGVGAYPWPLAKWHCGNEGVRMNRGWTSGMYVRGTGSRMCPDRSVVGAVVRPTYAYPCNGFASPGRTNGHVHEESSAASRWEWPELHGADPRSTLHAIRSFDGGGALRRL